MSIVISPGAVTHANLTYSPYGSIAVTTVTGGTAPLTYAWTSSAGASSVPAPTSLAAKTSLLPGQYTLTARDSTGVTSSCTFDVSWIDFPVPTYGPDSVSADYFGISCAVDGTCMAVGASGCVLSTGAVYVYRYAGSAWTFESKLTSPNPSSGNEFGRTVALDGDTLAVGEPGQGSSNSRAYVFMRTSGTTWTLQYTVTGNFSDFTGSCLSLSGDYLLVRSPKLSLGASLYGTAKVFHRTGTTWIQQGSNLDVGEGLVSDISATACATDGLTALVGNETWSRTTPTALSACGRIQVFSRSGTAWNKLAPLVSSDPSANDNFGRSVSVSGSYIFAGVENWTMKTPYVPNCGCAYVFWFDGSNWIQQSQLTAGDVSTAAFGNAVKVKGDMAVVGAMGAVNNAGKAYVFCRSGSAWLKVKVLSQSVLVYSSFLGCSVDFSSAYVVLGAKFAKFTDGTTSTGVVYVTPTSQMGIYCTANPLPFDTGYTGSLTVTSAFNGVAPLSYSWRSSSADLSSTNGATASQLPPGIYDVTVTDSTGAVGSRRVVLTTGVSNIVPSTIVNASGVASATGSVSVTSTVGTNGGPYNYAWTTSAGASVLSNPTVSSLTSLLPGQYSVRVTDKLGAAYSRTFDVSWTSTVSPFYVADGAAYDYFGYAVAVDGSCMAIGAKGRAASGYSSVGAVYVYRLTGSAWILEATLIPPAPLKGGTGLGTSVGVSGDTIVAGGNKCAYAFCRSGGSWSFQASLVQDDYSAAVDGYGSAVDVEGDCAVVGAPKWNQNSPLVSSSGAAYFFRRSGTTWAKYGPTLVPGDPQANASFGASVSVAGSTVAIGAGAWSFGSPVITLTNCGCAYVFRDGGTGWVQDVQLLAGDAVASAGFGAAVSVYGSRIAVGAAAWTQQYPSITGSGCAYVFEKVGGYWTQAAQLRPEDGVVGSGGLTFGAALKMRGDYLIAGAQEKGSKTGAAYLYKRNGSAWTKVKVVSAQDGATSDRFGYAVGLSDLHAVCGAYSWEGTYTDQGAAYAFPLQSISILSSTAKNASYGTSATGSVTVSAVGGTGALTYAWSSDATDVSSASSSSATGLDPGNYTLTVNDSTGAAAASSTYAVGTDLQVIIPGAVTHATGSSSATGSIGATSTSGAAGPYTYAWTSSAGASSVSTPTTLAAKSSLLPGRYYLSARDNVGVVSKWTYDVSWTDSSGTLSLAPDAAAGDLFGYSCAVDGTCAVVGAYKKATGGAAYVFRWSSGTGTWAPEATLRSPLPVASGDFGYSVDVSGDTVLVGERGACRAHVFVRTSGSTSGSTWTLQATLAQDDPSAGDNFGASVSLTGAAAVVGAPNWDYKSPVISDCGGAYVFVFDGTAWTKQAFLRASDINASVQFGTSVGIDGTVVVVGTQYWSRASPTAIANCGCAYVFESSGTTWTQKAQLVASDPSVGDTFGRSVCVSGTHVAAGSPSWSKKNPIVSGCGSAYVFRKAGSGWYQRARLTAEDDAATTQFGCAVRMRGSHLAVGAVGRGTGRGACYLFRDDGTTWIKNKVTAASDAAANDNLGNSVGLSSWRTIAGAPLRDGTAGADQGGAYSSSLEAFGIVPGPALPGRIGTATLTGSSGTYAASWTGVAAGSTLGPLYRLAAGTYVLSVADASGYSASYSYLVSTGYVPMVFAGGQVAPSSGAADGSIGAVVVSGGIAGPYACSWTWSAGATAISSSTSPSAKSGLNPGTYRLTATDGAQNVDWIDFKVPVGLAVVPGAVASASAYGTPTGSVGATSVSGGSGTYSYAWTSTGTPIAVQTPAAKVGLRAGTYVLTITDSEGQTWSRAFVVTEPPPSLSVTTTPMSFRASWDAYPGASGYDVGYRKSESSGDYVSFARNLGITSAAVAGLTPGESYFVRVYAVLSNGIRTPFVTGTAILPGNAVQNFSKAALLVPGSSRVYRSEALKASGEKASIMNAVFSTGDVVESVVTLSRVGTRDVRTEFVGLGGTAAVPRGGALQIPLAADGDSATLVSLGGREITVGYAGASIVFDGTPRSAGDAFVFEGQRVTVCEA